MLADRLDRLGELDLALVDLEPLPGDQLGEIRSGDRTEELPFFAGLGHGLELHAVELLLHRVQVRELLGELLVDDPLLVLDLVHLGVLVI